MSNEESKVPTPRELLKEKADLLGVEYKPNVTDKKLQELIEAKMNPKKDEPKQEVMPAAKTDDEIVSEAMAKQRKELSKLHRVIVSCNDPQMKDWESSPFYSFSNSIITLPRVSVPFNVEWHLPKAYYDMMKAMTCNIPTKGKDLKGRTITVPKEIKKYNIQDLPDLTIDEIKELKQAQAMRDGVAKV